MGDSNDQLRRARERTESPNATGQPLSRQELAELVNSWVYEHKARTVELDANYIGKLEQGVIRWPQDPDRRAGFRAVLGARTDAELGFRRPRRTHIMLGGVDRHEFIRATLGLTAGAALGGSAIGDLMGSLKPTPVPTVVGMTQVGEVRAAAKVFETWDNLRGGGLLREAVAAQLRYCAELLNARCPDRVRRELFSAVGYFGDVAGFMAFDSFAHDDARRIFRFALYCAEEADDWQLRAQILTDMAAHANRCADPDTGLTLIESAMVRTDRLTATQRAKLHTARARSLSKLGRVQDTAAAVGLADEEFSRCRPVDDPPWLAYYDTAGHSTATGIALSEVAVHGHFVAEARKRLSAAVAERGPAYARGRALTQAKLASLVMATGDPDEAAALGGQALDWAGALRSRRVAENLRELSRFGKAHQRRSGVADLRSRIAGAVVAT